MKIPRDTWYCSDCKFYVFNTKTKCNKCSKQKPCRFFSYDPTFDKTVCEYFRKTYLEQETSCNKCKNEGRLYNNQPMKSNHNCWKYS